MTASLSNVFRRAARHVTHLPALSKASLVRSAPKSLHNLGGIRCAATMLVDGKLEPALVSVHDLTFIRGDGAFEVVSLLPSSKNAAVGVPIGLKLHLDRLKSTCDSLRLPMKHDLDQITDWLHQVGTSNGPGSCRVILTRGQPSKGAEPKCIMLHDKPAEYPPALRLASMRAPWHIGYALPLAEDPPPYSARVAVDSWHTIKWMSYAPNCLVTRLAAEHGADDALLLASDGRILDGPNFAVGFILENKIKLIAADSNHMLPSCTQAMTLSAARSAGLPVEEGSVQFSEICDAAAAFVMSATRHIMPISAIDDKDLQIDHPLLVSLQNAYWDSAKAEVSAAS
eukprot:TRINITY_DN38914_c0_g1_i1.p1 TRINITY_DN38914_c0_g1~~TRINITY_DN38914_c0_g1_i1.p1  ORF type:complete len:341 (-),score=41.33 TRINITY_DN38914_c0_g1_i1:320-1342(-)